MSTSKVAPRTLPTLQRERARTMRNEATPAEAKLWSNLRASSLNGHKFSRQISIGPFICDLVCRKSKLIVELDGSQHNGETDRSRTTYLEAHGYRVTRFSNVHVLEDADAAARAVMAALAESAPPPPPTPPASGRGAC